MPADPSELSERLRAISEDLADLALTLLREAAERVRAGDQPDPALVAEERRVTRARRAVIKAAQLLEEPPGPEPD